MPIQNFPYTNFHESNNDWLLEKVKFLSENNCSGNTYNISQTIKEVEPIVESTLFPRKIRSYTYMDLEKDINSLILKYPKVRHKCIGNSVLGLNLNVLEYGAENANKHLFVFNGGHGNENTASIALSQLETLILNQDSYYGVNLWEDILSVDTCIHVFPMVNPDAWTLGQFGFGFFPNMNEKQKELITTTFTEYMRTQAKDEAVGSAWTVEEKEEIAEYIKSLGGDPTSSWADYQFREKDLHAWSANANGIDLYYNWYTEEMNKNNFVFNVSKNYTNNHIDCWRYGACGKEPYLDENKIYKEYIDSFINDNFLGSALYYHQKGPTKIWNYGIEGYQKNRNRDCFEGLCEITGTPFTKTFKDSYAIGFNAWFQRYCEWNGTLACNCEVGFKYDKLSGDGWNDQLLSDEHIVRSPVPDYQWYWIYRQEKYTFLYMIRFYSSLRDVWSSHGNLTAFNLKDSYTNEKFAVPSMILIKKISDAAGIKYTSVTDIGFTASNATIQGIVNNLNYEESLLTGVTESAFPKIAESLPSFAFSKTGYLHFYPNTKSQCVVEFHPQNTPFIYRKVYQSTGYISNWINVTDVICDPHCFGITVPIERITAKVIAKLIPENHTLKFYVSSQTTITDVPSEAGANYNISFEGSRNQVFITLESIRPGEIFRCSYSRSGDNLTSWYKFTGSAV